MQNLIVFLFVVLGNFSFSQADEIESYTVGELIRGTAGRSPPPPPPICVLTHYCSQCTFIGLRRCNVTDTCRNEIHDTWIEYCE